MKEVKFKSDGERITIAAAFGNAQIASYRLRVWEGESNAVVLDKSGNNQNPNDDSYDLPLPTKNNDGRLVQCEASIVSPSAASGEKYSVSLVFKQGGKVIDKLSETGPMNGKRIATELWATLKAQ